MIEEQKSIRSILEEELNSGCDAFKEYIENAFRAGYNTAKNENEWKPIEIRPESGRVIVHRHKDAWGNFQYQVILFDGIENVPANGYEWKYID